jgi:hypothetical protein
MQIGRLLYKKINAYFGFRQIQFKGYTSFKLYSNEILVIAS